MYVLQRYEFCFTSWTSQPFSTWMFCPLIYIPNSLDRHFKHGRLIKKVIFLNLTFRWQSSMYQYAGQSKPRSSRWKFCSSPWRISKSPGYQSHLSLCFHLSFYTTSIKFILLSIVLLFLHLLLSLSFYSSCVLLEG